MKRWLEQGLAHPGGLVPLFTGEAEPVDQRLVKQAFLNGWVEAFPASRDGTFYLACRLTANGRALFNKEGGFDDVSPISDEIKHKRSEKLSDTEAIVLATLRAASQSEKIQPSAKRQWSYQRIAGGFFLVLAPALAGLFVLLDYSSDSPNQRNDPETRSEVVEAQTDDALSPVKPPFTKEPAREAQSNDETIPAKRAAAEQPDQGADSNPALGQSANGTGSAEQERYWEGIVNLMVNEPSGVPPESERGGQSVIAERGGAEREPVVSEPAQESVPPLPTPQVPDVFASAPPGSAEIQLSTSNGSAPRDGEVIAKNDERADPSFIPSPLDDGSVPTPSRERNAARAADLAAQSQINKTQSFRSGSDGPAPQPSEAGDTNFSPDDQQSVDATPTASKDIEEAEPRLNEETVVSALSADSEFDNIEPRTDAPRPVNEGEESSLSVSGLEDPSLDRNSEDEGEGASTLPGTRSNQDSDKTKGPEETGDAAPTRPDNSEDGQTDQRLTESSSSLSASVSLIEDAADSDEEPLSGSSSSQSSNFAGAELAKDISDDGASVSEDTDSEAKSEFKTQKASEEAAAPSAEEIGSTEAAVKTAQGTSSDSSSEITTRTLSGPAPSKSVDDLTKEPGSEEKRGLSAEDPAREAETVVNSQSTSTKQAEDALSNEAASAITLPESGAGSLLAESPEIARQAPSPGEEADVASSVAQKEEDQSQPTEQNEIIPALPSPTTNQEQNTQNMRLGPEQQNDPLRAAPPESEEALGNSRERKLSDGEGTQPLEVSPSELPSTATTQSALDPKPEPVGSPRQSADLSLSPPSYPQTKSDKISQLPKNKIAGLIEPDSPGNNKGASREGVTKPGYTQSSGLKDPDAESRNSSQEKKPASDEVQSASSSPVAQPAAAPGFTVQFASLDSEDAAQTAAALIGKRLDKIVGELELHVVKGVVSDRTYFRVRTQKNLSLEAARDICTNSKAEGQDCFVSKK